MQKPNTRHKTPKAKQTRKRRLRKFYIAIYRPESLLRRGLGILLFFIIIMSIILVMLESIESIDQKYHEVLLVGEWIITILFTVEYITRIIVSRKPKKYIFSFYGIVDLLATIPMYLSYVVTGSHVLIAFRVLRLLRIFRILKLIRLMKEATQLKAALKASGAKIAVFIYVMFIISIIMGTVMYLIESDQSGFSSIPRGIYWTIVTMTTVGYGDIAPQTPLGQALAAMIMILGYGIIAVPTGIVTVEYSRQKRSRTPPPPMRSCSNCNETIYNGNAKYCHQCGTQLHES